MNLFSRKKSVSTSSHSDIRSNTPSSPAPTTSPSERPSEPHTPLYERFKNTSLELSANSSGSRSPFVGNGSRPYGASKTDPLLDAPPTSYFSRTQPQNGSPSTSQSVSIERHPVGIGSPEPMQALSPTSKLSKPETRKKASLPVKEISRPLVLNGTRPSQSASSSKTKRTSHRSGTKEERLSTSKSSIPPTVPPSKSSALPKPQNSHYGSSSLDVSSPPLTNGTGSLHVPPPSPPKAGQSIAEKSRDSRSNHPSVAKPQAVSPPKQSEERGESAVPPRPNAAPRRPSTPPAESLPKISNALSISVPSNQKHTPTAMTTHTTSSVYHSSPRDRGVPQSLDVLPPVGPPKPRNTPPVSGSPLASKRHSLSQAGDSKSTRSLGTRAPSPGPQPPITYDLVGNGTSPPPF